MNNCGIFLLIICGCYSIGGITQKCNFPLFSGVWTAAFAWQSALFALATIRPLDELLYASRPYHRSPLQGTHGDRVAGDNSTRLTQSVTIAIPSLRSLRSRHNQRHFSYCATSLCAPATQQHGAVACTLTSSPTLDLLAAVAARVPSSKLHISFTNKKCVSERYYLKRKKFVIEMKSKEGASCRQA